MWVYHKTLEASQELYGKVGMVLTTKHIYACNNVSKGKAKLANTEDPDQTAPVCTVCTDLSKQKLRIIMIKVYTKLETYPCSL